MKINEHLYLEPQEAPQGFLPRKTITKRKVREGGTLGLENPISAEASQ